LRQALPLLLVAITALLPVGAIAACSPPPAANDGWAVITPEAVGLNAPQLCGLVPWVEGGKKSDIHAVLVARRGELAFEQYFSGADERWGTPLGDGAHARDQLHDARSVTKSVVALVLGIA
jgi:CubicO group peptidase (beta-lactamase class C family)